jgi:hypothetical protein
MAHYLRVTLARWSIDTLETQAGEIVASSTP